MTITNILAGAPLILIDLQKAIDHPDWGIRNNPDAEQNLSRILAVWRENTWPVIHIKHDSINPTSHYRIGQIGNEFKPCVKPLSGETVLTKTTNSAFVEAGLRNTLEAQGYKTIIIAGVKTNNSIETTVRHGGNLGYDITLLADACFTHDQIDWTGKHWSAEDIHAIALSNMDGEYCRVRSVDEVISEISAA